MNHLCQPCYDALLNMGRSVEVYSSRPISSGPCAKCGEPTQAYIVPWSDWQTAPYYPVE